MPMGMTPPRGELMVQERNTSHWRDGPESGWDLDAAGGFAWDLPWLFGMTSLKS